jgi:hypothetical protein
VSGRGGGASEARTMRAGKQAGGGTGGSPRRQEVEEREKKVIFMGPMLRCHFTVCFYKIRSILHRFEHILVFMVSSIHVLRINDL